MIQRGYSRRDTEGRCTEGRYWARYRAIQVRYRGGIQGEIQTGDTRRDTEGDTLRDTEGRYMAIQGRYRGDIQGEIQGETQRGYTGRDTEWRYRARYRGEIQGEIQRGIHCETQTGDTEWRYWTKYMTKYTMRYRGALCKSKPHTTHLFNCTNINTQLHVMDLWTAPVEMGHLLVEWGGGAPVN